MKRKNIVDAKRQLALFSLKATEHLRSTSSKAKTIIASLTHEYSAEAPVMEYLDLVAKVITSDGEEKTIYRSSMGYSAMETDKVVDGILSQMFSSFMDGIRFSGLPRLDKVNFQEQNRLTT